MTSAPTSTRHSFRRVGRVSTEALESIRLVATASGSPWFACGRRYTADPMSDLTFAFRQLRKNLVFTAVAVLTLGLGIGTNTALFSVINAFLLRPLAVAEPHRLVGVYNGSKKNPDDWRGFSYASYLDVRNRNEVFADVLAHQTTNAVVSTDDRSHAGYVDLVSANFFSVLG